MADEFTRVPDDLHVTCPLCKGTGRKEYASFHKAGRTIERNCSLCSGHGRRLIHVEEIIKKLVEARDALTLAKKTFTDLFETWSTIEDDWKVGRILGGVTGHEPGYTPEIEELRKAMEKL